MKPKSSSIRRSAYLQFLLLQGLHLGAIWLLIEMGAEPGTLICAGGVINILNYARLLWGDVKGSPEGLNPIWLYLGMSILRIGVGSIYVAIVVWTGNEDVLGLGRIDPLHRLAEGHLLILGGDYLFVLSAHLVGAENRSQEVVVDPVDVYRAGLACAATSFVVRISEAAGILPRLGQIVDYLATFGLPAGIFLMLESCRRRRISLISQEGLVALVLQAITIAGGFSSYMKSDLLISILPLVLISLAPGLAATRRLASKVTLGTWLGLALTAYFFLFTVSGYSQLRRPGYWENMARGDLVPTEEAAPEVWPDLSQAMLASIPGTEAFEEMHQFPYQGVWHIINRLSVTSWGGTAVSIVERDGTRPEGLLKGILLSVTPRVFFPDKPDIVWGREVAVAVGLASSVETAKSAISLTMPGFFYWWGGPLTVIGGAICSGIGFSFVFQRFRDSWKSNPASALVVIALVWNALHWKESDVLGGAPLYLYMLIVFLPLSRFLQMRSR